MFYIRFLRGVDMKMSSSSRGFSIGNASEVSSLTFQFVFYKVGLIIVRVEWNDTI